MSTERRFLTTADLARLVHREPQTVRLWRARNYGPPWIDVSGRCLYEVADVERWLESRKRRSSHASTTAPAR